MIVTVIANQAGNFNWEYKVVIFLVCMIYCLHASHLGNRFEWKTQVCSSQYQAWTQ